MPVAARKAKREPLVPHEDLLPPAERIRMKFDVLLARKKAQDNPYKKSFYQFLTLLYTVDEARGGEVRPWPFGTGADGRSWDLIWRDWETILLTCSPLFVDKTRRVMASNVCTAFELWVAAGGQDPRWPTLMQSDRNRLILIQSKKLEDETGSAAFVDRMKRMVEVAEENGLRKHWPDFPEFGWRFAHGLSSNGSRIEAVPQGAEQIRGPGSTIIRMEEAGFMEKIQDHIDTAIPALASNRQFGGHLILVTTPNAGATYLRRLREGTTGRSVA